MVSFPPYMPSARWSADFLQSIAFNKECRDAIVEANCRLDTPKEFGRFKLRDVNRNMLTLSLAVDGGGRRLRNMNLLDECILSEHGEWRRNHMGALEACLGRKPFYRDLEPHLSEVILNKNLRSLKDFNSAIFFCVLSFLMGNLRVHDLSLFHSREELKQRGKEISKEINKEASVIEIIAERGRESILGLLSL